MHSSCCLFCFGFVLFVWLVGCSCCGWLVVVVLVVVLGFNQSNYVLNKTTKTLEHV